MSVSRILAVGLVIAALAAPAFAKPKASTSLKPQFQALYAKMDDTVRHGDYNKFISFYDGQFIEHGYGQPVQYIAEFSQGWQGNFRVLHFMNPMTTVDSLKPWGHGVIVYVHTHETYECPDKADHNVRLHIIDDETDEDYWVKRNGVWKMREEIELSVHLWENGMQIQ